MTQRVGSGEVICYPVAIDVLSLYRFGHSSSIVLVCCSSVVLCHQLCACDFSMLCHCSIFVICCCMVGLSVTVRCVSYVPPRITLSFHIQPASLCKWCTMLQQHRDLCPGCRLLFVRARLSCVSSVQLWCVCGEWVDLRSRFSGKSFK